MEISAKVESSSSRVATALLLRETDAPAGMHDTIRTDAPVTLAEA